MRHGTPPYRALVFLISELSFSEGSESTDLGSQFSLSNRMAGIRGLSTALPRLGSALRSR